MTTREIVIAYIGAIERMDLEAVAGFLHPELEIREHPNKLSPAGRRSDLAAVKAAGERGKALMARQRYEIRSLIVEGDRACAQIAWTGVLMNGTEMRAEVCSVIELEGGKVRRQEQYDCFG
jgi:ketosteroid isomerase-like protein